MKKKKYNKQIKWHDASKFVPDNDRQVLLFIRDTENITFTRETIGNYSDVKFFYTQVSLKEKVIRWCEIPHF